MIETAGELLAFANKLDPGTLRNNIVRQAGTLVQKSFGAVEGQSAGVRSIAS